MIEHHAVANVIEVMKKIYPVTGEKRNIATYCSYVFDISVSEFFAALLQGGELHILSDEARYQVEKLSHYIKQHHIHYLYVPPAILTELPKIIYPDLQAIMIGGELCDAATARYWADHTVLINMYGPTEATIHASYTEVVKAKVNVIGKPISNIKMYVLDKEKNPC